MPDTPHPARAPMGVSICARGCAHLRFGATTIHLTAEEFRAFLHAAHCALQGPAAGNDPAAGFQFHGGPSSN